MGPLVSVVFLRPANTGLCYYAAGERAGFPEETAEHLISRGFARRLSVAEQAELRRAYELKREAEARADRDAATEPRQ
jgi:hypothetical protein